MFITEWLRAQGQCPGPGHWPDPCEVKFKVLPCIDPLEHVLNQALETCCHQSGLESPNNTLKRVLSS